VGRKKKHDKQADKKYGRLESARPDRRTSSTRYTSEPRKQEPKSVYVPMADVTNSKKHAAAEVDETDKNAKELQVPVVAENDYLLPQSGASAPYVDFMADNTLGINSSVLVLSLQCTLSAHFSLHE